MLKRFVVVTQHGEGRTVWAVMDTEGDMECVASYSSARGETFGEAYQDCNNRNDEEENAMRKRRATLVRTFGQAWS